MRKVRVLYFWVVAFSCIAWNVLKGNEWSMVYVDLHCGDNANGSPIRKQLIAKKSFGSLDIYWQDASN